MEARWLPLNFGEGGKLILRLALGSDTDDKLLWGSTRNWKPAGNKNCHYWWLDSIGYLQGGNEIPKSSPWGRELNHVPSANILKLGEEWVFSHSIGEHWVGVD